MRRNGLGRVRNVAEVGFVILIQRRGNANDDGIHVSQAGIVRGGLEALGAGLLNFAGQNTRNVSLALGQSRNLALINIETRYSQLLLCKKQPEGADRRSRDQ